jgi:hypothetical protein
MPRKSGKSAPIKRSEYGFALSFVPRGGLFGSAAARAVLAGLQEMAFDGRCEYYTWQSLVGDNYVVSLALRERTTRAAPSYEWWKTFARIVAGRISGDDVQLDVHSSALASVDSMRRNSLPCGAVEFTDGRPTAKPDRAESWFLCECSDVIDAYEARAH